jgi:hypothetical protein
MIDRSLLVDMFERMTRQGVDLTQELLWGYFFTDPDREKLERAGRELEAAGYRFVEIFGGPDDPDPAPTFYLHVEQIERHDVSSLDARNGVLTEFAEEWGLESYDGMDVGPVDGKGFPKPRD